LSGDTATRNCGAAERKTTGINSSNNSNADDDDDDDDDENDDDDGDENENEMVGRMRVGALFIAVHEDDSVNICFLVSCPSFSFLQLEDDKTRMQSRVFGKPRRKEVCRRLAEFF
jgi:hypothetical protein